MRAFLAIEVSDEARREIVNVIEVLKKSGLFTGKFVEPPHLHVTLKFFGDILEKEAGMIHEVLRTLEFPTFSCSLGKLGLFADRILWIDLEDHGSLKKMHGIIDEKLGDFFGREERFHNHITLARIKHLPDPEKLRVFLKQMVIQPVSFTVKEYLLKKSVLLPSGPEYEDVFTYDLV